MLEFNSILSDLEKYYPNSSFKNKDLIVERLKHFFTNKFNIFLQNNNINSNNTFELALSYLNENGIFPLNKMAVGVNSLVGLKQPFIEEYRDDLFNFIPIECKKEKSGMIVSRLSEKNLLDYNNFLFYKFLSSFSLVYDFNFSLLLTNFELTLEDFDERLHYLFNDVLVSDVVSYAPFTMNSSRYPDALLKDCYFEALELICPEHFFTVGTWYNLHNFERYNSETRKIIDNKVSIYEELIRRNLSSIFFRDFDEIIYRKTSGIDREINYFEDIFSVLTICRNTRKHLL